MIKFTWLQVNAQWYPSLHKSSAKVVPNEKWHNFLAQ